MGKMSKTFVILVSLYIGVASGFMAPSGAPEILNESTTLSVGFIRSKCSKLQGCNKSNEMANSLLNPSNLGLNRQNEKALFEDVTEKESNVNERSLLVLNQKFRTPLLNKLYDSQLMALLNNEENSLKRRYSFIQAPKRPVKSEKSFFQPNLNREMHKVRDPGDYFVPQSYACNEYGKLKSFYERENQPVYTGKGTKQEVIQFLKTSSVGRIDNSDRHIDSVIKNKNILQQFIDNRDNLHRIKTPTDIRPSENIRTKYGFLEPLSKVFLDKHANRIDANNVISDVAAHKENIERFNNKSEEDNVDSITKGAVEDKIISRNTEARSKNCNYRECFRATGNPHSSHNSEGQNKPHCKCFNNKVKQRERKELSTVQTEEPKIEDTSMDQFLNILRT